jgi:RNA polymerase sigma-19 factor, ECF subfamily
VFDVRAAGDNGQDGDPHLIAAIRAGDRMAFERLYRAYWPRLVAFARKYGARSIAEAQELVQDIFFELWRTRERLAIQHGITAYLFGAVRNRVHRARRVRLRVLWPVRPLRASVDNSGEHRPIVGELAATIEAIVDAMPGRCREVYHLRYTEGLSTPAIAAALKLSVVTVKRHHARALHLLARGLADTEWADVLRRVIHGTAYGSLEPGS